MFSSILFLFLFFYFCRLHFDSLYTNGIHLFVSMVVHDVDSHHSCNHICTLGNDVCLIPPSFIPPPLLPLIPICNLQFLHSSLTPHPIVYHHLLIRENIWPLVLGDQLISLSMIFSNSIHLSANAIIFFFMTE